MRRNRVVGGLLVAMLGGIMATALWLDYHRFLEREVPPNGSEPYFLIPRGASLQQVSQQLVAEGYLAEPYRFMMLAVLKGQAKGIKAGEYGWGEGLTPRELLALLISGRVVQHSITLVEGWTFRDAVQVLEADERLAGNVADLTDGEIMTRLGRPDRHPEGLFFPDTYNFPRGTPRLAVLRRAMERMDAILAEEWAQRTPGLPLGSPYEALILASIVEKETAVEAERAQVAGVFIRRLQRGMRLQTDPTVIYGLGADYQGRLGKVDLRRDQPYNTYTRDGLPPTPIALPGRASIAATLSPADGDALYFVAKGDGSHHFSSRLSEHNRAVRRYILNGDG